MAEEECPVEIPVELIDDRYQRGNVCVIVPEGDEPPPIFDGLDFSNSYNSQYLPLITGGGL